MQNTTISRKPMDKILFEEECTIEALSQMGNLLEQLATLVDFDMFRPALEDVLIKKDCKTPAVRPQSPFFESSFKTGQFKLNIVS